MKKYLVENPLHIFCWLLLFIFLATLACTSTISAIEQPTQTTAKVAEVSAGIAVYGDASVDPTPMTVGNMTAEVLHVRADHDLSAEVVGYLYFNDPVLEMDCITEDGITWVKHETGWSVVRNKTAEYIAGVCRG